MKASIRRRMGEVEVMLVSRLLRVSRSAIVGACNCCVPVSEGGVDSGDDVERGGGYSIWVGFSPVAYHVSQYIYGVRVSELGLHTIE